jgi:hypothetical protein
MQKYVFFSYKKRKTVYLFIFRYILVIQNNKFVIQMDIHEYMSDHKYGLDFTKEPMYGKLEYFDFEKGLINHIVDNQFTIIKKSRQMHVTTLLSNYASHFLESNTGVDNKILYLSKSIDSSKMFIEKVKTNLYAKPFKHWFTINNKHSITIGGLNTLSILNSEDSFNQLDDLASIHTIIIDEGAFIRDVSRYLRLFDYSIADKRPNSLSSNVKIILASTTNNLNDFYTEYEHAMMGSSKYKPYSVNYKDNPRFNVGNWFDSVSIHLDNDGISQELLAEFVNPKPIINTNKYNLIQLRVDDAQLMGISHKLIEKDITMSNYIRGLIDKDINS